MMGDNQGLIHFLSEENRVIRKIEGGWRGDD